MMSSFRSAAAERPENPMSQVRAVAGPDDDVRVAEAAQPQRRP